LTVSVFKSTLLVKSSQKRHFEFLYLSLGLLNIGWLRHGRFFRGIHGFLNQKNLLFSPKKTLKKGCGLKTAAVAEKKILISHSFP